jgi:hypothetical protein
MLRPWLIAALFCPLLTAAEPATIDQALDRLYNFDFPKTHEILNRYIAANPQDPQGYAFRASAYLFYELDRMGILEGEFFSTDDWAYDKKKKPVPDAAIRDQFLKALQDTNSRGEAILKTKPDDTGALFALSIAQGVTADYMALIDKRQFGSLSPSKKSNSYAQQLLRADPKFYDAYLTAGFSEYMIGSLPFFVRWFVHFENISGSKEQGKQHLELTAKEGHYFKAFAKILLAIAALREKRPQDAQKLVSELTREYPGNPLFRKELAKLNSKLGIAAN